MRKSIAIATALTLSISLAGCTSASDDGSLPGVKAICEQSVGGSGIEKVSVSGALGAVPTTKIAAPATSDKIETKIIIEGTGPKFTGGQLVEFEYTALNGGTGDQLESTNFDGTNAVSQLFSSGGYPDICHGLSGAREGSRIAMLFPAEFAHKGEGIPDGAISKTDSIVYVVDLIRVYLPYAIGDSKPSQTGFPSVVRAENGTPGITQLKTEAPAEFKLATLIKGAGAVVKQGDVLKVHYSGFVWGGEPFDSSWERGEPAEFQLSEGQLIKGFIKALDGQTVGSQVIAIIPPSEGYGEAEQGKIPANSTLIFVVDILGIKTPAK